MGVKQGATINAISTKEMRAAMRRRRSGRVPRTSSISICFITSGMRTIKERRGMC